MAQSTCVHTYAHTYLWCMYVWIYACMNASAWTFINYILRILQQHRKNNSPRDFNKAWTVTWAELTGTAGREEECSSVWANIKECTKFMCWSMAMAARNQKISTDSRKQYSLRHDWVKPSMNNFYVSCTAEQMKPTKPKEISFGNQ